MENSTLLHSEACCPHCSHTHHEKKDTKSELIIFILGLVIFSLALFAKLPDVFKTFMFLAAYLAFGREVVFTAVKNLFKGKIFDENFLMTVATVGAFIIGEYPEAVAVMLFFQIGEYFQDKALNKSRSSIKALMDLAPEYANKETKDGIIKVKPEDVSIGDIIIVKPGEKLPIDGIIAEGSSNLDLSSLTGESEPCFKQEGEEILSGCVNVSSLIKVKTTKEYKDSTVVKILELVENASAKKAPTEKFITKFCQIYTPVVVFSALALALGGPLLVGGGFAEWANRALVFLVVSCPCALVISVPLTFFSGIGLASRRGILLKGGNTLQTISQINTVVFDKTGTLTKGVFEVNEVVTYGNSTETELLESACVVLKYSNHPVAKSVVKYCGEIAEANINITDVKEIGGHGVTGYINKNFIVAGNIKLMESNNINTEKTNNKGTTVYVGKNGNYLGYIAISDVIKPDSKKAVSGLMKKGIDKIIMLTGDNEEGAKKVSQEIGISQVYSNLLPHEKVEVCERLYMENPEAKIAFLGDGINDAPLLARCDVGVAMGGIGSDASIEAADVVIMNDEPSKICEAIDISKKTMSVVKQNITFSLVVKIGVLILAALGFANMWMAVFADVGVTLLVILYSIKGTETH